MNKLSRITKQGDVSYLSNFYGNVLSSNSTVLFDVPNVVLGISDLTTLK